MFDRIKKNLLSPYPQPDYGRADFLTAVLIGAFVAFFLIFFQPFGLSQFEFEHKNLILIGFGLVTTICLILVDFLIAPIVQKTIQEEKFTVLHWVLWNLFIVFVIANGNFIYRGILFQFSPDLYFSALGTTMAIGLFPILTLGLLNRIRFLKQNDESAKEIQSHLHEEEKPLSNSKIVLESENGKDQIEVDSSELLYIENLDNYVAIHLSRDGKEAQETLRNSMRELEQQLAGTSMARCHRSYIVNTSLVQKVSGNAQGWRLSLDTASKEVPVSRKYIPGMKELLVK